MCGRYTLHAPPEELARIFRLPLDEVHRVFDFGPRYNIAPTDDIAAVRVRRGGESREPAVLRWGLVPYWTRDPGIGARMINARGESVAGKPAFRDAFRERRCLVVADGFYEWQKLTGRKQPYYLRMRDGEPFAFAGLWDRWEGQGQGQGQGQRQEPIESCTIITTEPNELARALHDRMPVILRPEDYDRWLDPVATDLKSLEVLLRPFPSELMIAYPVSTLVNKPENDAPECIEPLDRPLFLEN